MSRIILCILLISAVVLSGAAFAQLAKPKIYPQEGQTKEQQQKDYLDCHYIAINKTGIDPDMMEIRLRAVQSMQTRAARPGPGNDLTLSPSKHRQVQEYKDDIKEIEQEHEKYLKAFSDAMEERGYKVKY